ncbi:Tetratricopeptide repeat protein 39B [Halotydeus destructor]|nr:Tetratricopeptide repeat protein 39B [Halotydeus destructor]
MAEKVDSVVSEVEAMSVSDLNQMMAECDLPVVDTDVNMCDMSAIDFEKSCIECMKVLKLVISNRHQEANVLVRAKAKKSMLHSEGLCLLIAIEGLLSLEKETLGKALQSATEAMAFADKLRKKDHSYFFKTEPNSYTDVECHAEQSYHELQLVYGFLVPLYEQSVVGFIKGAINLRSGFSGLKGNERIMAKKDNWSSDYLRDEFAAGVMGCLGLFDMVISFFPRKFITLLELVGFSGDRGRGLESMKQVASLKGTMRSVGGIVGVGAYHGFFEFFYGLGNPDKELSYQIVDNFSSLADSGSYLTLLAQGWKQQLSGNFTDAISLFSQSVNHVDTPRKFTYAIYWQMAWIHALNWDWESAIECSRILKESRRKWPRRFEAGHFGNAKSYPGLKRHLGGKKAFHEKIVIEKSKYYSENMEKMVCAPLDLIYLWNIFSYGSYHKPTLSSFISRMDHKLVDNPRNKWPDTYSLLTFTKGVCLSKADNKDGAETCFMEVISMEKEIDSERHLVPQATFEMGLLKSAGDKDGGKAWLKKSKNYKNYLTDAMINYRADIALASLD